MLLENRLSGGLPVHVFYQKGTIYFQVGAAIVNEEKKIVGIGYNGFPKG